MRVLSYNVWGVPYIAPERAERIEEIGRQVAELSPDLVAMQEVWDPRDAARADRIVRLEDGKIVDEQRLKPNGEPDDVLNRLEKDS